MIKLITKISALVLVLGSASSFAGTTLAIQGGYSLTNSSLLEGGIVGAATLETRLSNSFGLGVFGGYQMIKPTGLLASLSAYTLPFGAVANVYLGNSFYIGANGGMQKLTFSGGTSTASGNQYFAGGQVGLLFNPHLGLEGKYLYSMTTGGLNIIQMTLQYRFSL